MAVDIAKAKAAQAECPQCFAGDLTWLLANANWALATEMTAALAPLELTARSYHVLRAASNGEYTQKALAELVGIDKTTMVVTIDELEEAGLAERRPSPTDRRAHVIVVTKAGERRLAKAEVVQSQVQGEALDALPTAQRKAFVQGLATMLEGLMTDLPECSGAPRRKEPRP
ncbi:MAG: MarR family transcriptional regulator, transcriptional regulator for hemolysin [Solirubrobacterales bacterium]|jgi:DNA-binding MarR family transcriptional regulator|nr:MarR family transcriptional regulator, transcriptional regulator for hemolysin [Solirubrobacterales bacterium]